MNSATLQRWSLNGKKALITGGTKGIGEAAANELLALGASVVIVARNADEVAARVAEAHDVGASLYGVAADMATEVGREAALDFALKTLGGLDILVNNVGMNIRKPSLEYTDDEYQQIISTNLTSAWSLCRMAHPHLRRDTSAPASIVNIGSVSGVTVVGSGAPYAMSKAALDHMTRYLAVEWAKDGIRVNGIDPWYIKTPLAAPVLDDPAKLARVLARTPNGQLGEPEHVGATVAFLCLPAAHYITGQCIGVDGGYLSNGVF